MARRDNFPIYFQAMKNEYEYGKNRRSNATEREREGEIDRKWEKEGKNTNCQKKTHAHKSMDARSIRVFFFVQSK